MFKLNKKGFTHDTLIILIVIIFAIVGVGFLVFSRAATTTYTSTNDWPNWNYIKGSTVTTDLTHSNTGSLLLQFNQGVTTYHNTDTAMYQYTLPANTTATNITFNANYADGGYDTVFLAAGSPTNYVWKVSTAANVSNQNVTVNFSNSPTTIYFGIKYSGSSGGFAGTTPANRNLKINSYTLNGITTTASTTPTVTLSANPTSINSGTSSTLSWTSTNATSCNLSGALNASEPTSGSVSTGNLTATSNYTMSCTGSGGTSSSTTTVTVNTGSGGTGSGPGGTGGDGTIIFDGTFDPSFSKYPTHYYNAPALTYINPNQAKFYVTTADSLPGNLGHYRADLISPATVNQVGRSECTTIPIQFPNGLATVPHDSWFQFAEQKSPSVDYQSWSMGVSSWYNGYVNSWTIGFDGVAGNGRNDGSPVWVGPAIDNGIHTFSVCLNNASDNTGKVYGIWMDGVRQTFNQGAYKGLQTLSGFPNIIGLSSYPMEINDYTGGSPVPNTLIHGDPLVATMGTNGLPPMPPSGWRSFH